MEALGARGTGEMGRWGGGGELRGIPLAPNRIWI